MANNEAQSSLSGLHSRSRRCLLYCGFIFFCSLFQIRHSLRYAAIFDESHSFIAEPNTIRAHHHDDTAPIESSIERKKSTSNKASTHHNTGGSSSSGGVVLVVEQEPQSFENSSSFLQISRFSSKPECTPLLPHQVSMTLTTQLSLDRMWIMKYQCDRWPVPQPISIAVYLPHDDKRNESFVTDDLERLGCDLSRMTITILKDSKGTLRDYPVNQLRNLALEGVQTTHAAYIDSDFMISRGLHGSLIQTAAAVVAKTGANSNKVAIVMPAFEYVSDCSFDVDQQALRACLDEEALPETQVDLLTLLKRTKKQRPKVQRGYQNFKGLNHYHSTTRYTEWTNATEPMQIPCLRTVVYEPYLAVQMCRDLPQFPEVFTGWGFNKVMWILLLWKKLGFQLWQIPREFVIHLPHAESTATRIKGDTKPPAVERWMKWYGNLTNHENRLIGCQTYDKQRKEEDEARKANVVN